jgi:Flp pilus assembly protein protease CpaA
MVQGVIFLVVIGLLWVCFASIQDLRKREVANWISFSLIVFALGFRFFYSLFDETWGFFLQGLIGFGIFFALGNLMYYGRLFAGGDAKLMIALGAVLPFSLSFYSNLKVFFLFLILFLFVGAVYGVVSAVFLSLKNFNSFKNGFFKIWKEKKRLSYLIMVLGLVFMVLGFLQSVFLYFGVLVFVFPYLYYYAKAVDEFCMVKNTKVSALTEGDWLYGRIKVGKKLIGPSWEGLNSKDIQLIKKKYKYVKIKQGIPFVPVFFIAFLILVYLWFSGLWNAFW